MNGPTAEKAKLGPPPRWLKCPRRGQLVAGKFLPFKTPLCSLYDDVIPEQYRFPVDMVFSSHKIGLWIDLTNTDRFYNPSDVEKHEAKYVKLNCRGHGECPSEEQTKAFVHICKNFFMNHADKIIAVHCTHGFNRTGFLISSYLIKEHSWSVDAALNEFGQRRSPGIYKQDYIDELFKRNDEDPKYAPMAPALPDWCDESEPILDDHEADGSTNNGASSSKSNKKAAFVDGVPGIVAVSDPYKTLRIRRLCQQWCGFGNKSGFAGSQPVSMDRSNLGLLGQKLYKVSWKADGVRYMMLMEDRDEIYMLDRDNNVFAIPNLRFPSRIEPNRDLKETLVDGELIFDMLEGKKTPRYLIYDVIRLEGQPIGSYDFERRFACIKSEIVDPRQEAKRNRTIDPRYEPFSIRRKDFWDITTVEKIFSEKFQKSMSHEIDGLIFQPVPDPYTAGRCDQVLKWKPHELNSVDFKLKIVLEQKEGMLKQSIGYLYVLHLQQPFSTIKATKELKQYDNKIIECTFDEKKGWQFLRERRDKSFPNAYETAMGVCRSIKEPITKELLIDFIKAKAIKPKLHNAQHGSHKRPVSDTVDGESTRAKRTQFDESTTREKELMPPPTMPR